MREQLEELRAGQRRLIGRSMMRLARTEKIEDRGQGSRTRLLLVTNGAGNGSGVAAAAYSAQAAAVMPAGTSAATARSGAGHIRRRTHVDTVR